MTEQGRLSHYVDRLIAERYAGSTSAEFGKFLPFDTKLGPSTILGQTSDLFNGRHPVPNNLKFLL